MTRCISLPFLSICLIACPVFAQTVIPGGPVSGHWTLAGSPYLIQGEITLNPLQILLIDPGVDVIFQGHYKFIVRGVLTAVGTEADSITFTAADTSGGWHGLRFYYLNTQPDSSRLVYCKITYGQSSATNYACDDKHGGAIFCRDSAKLLIQNCLICYNRTGDVVGANGYNGSGGGGVWGNDGGPGESVSSGHGGAIYIIYSSTLIINNTICFNRTGNAIGGNGGSGESIRTFGTQAYGGEGGGGGYGKSGYGGAIYCHGGIPTFYGNTIFHNATGIGTGGQGGSGGNAIFMEWGNWAYAGYGGNGGSGEGGSGGAIYFYNANCTWKNNLLYLNKTGGGFGGSGGNGGYAMSWLGAAAEYGGTGGDGGDGRGGNGGTFYFQNCNPPIDNNTICLSSCGHGNGGIGGSGGYGCTGSGFPGNPGAGIEGSAVLYCDHVSEPTIANSIIWENGDCSFAGNPQVNYSCIQGGYPGIGNINVNPLFVSNPVGDYFLSQIDAGQPVQSPCVDAGCPDSSMVIGTTRTDGVQDEGIVDMGFHNPCFTPQPFLFVSPSSLIFEAVVGFSNPDNQTFEISNTFVGTFYYQITENIDWLTAAPMSGGPVPPIATISVSVDISGLSAGTYQGDITVIAPGAIGSPTPVHVTLLLGQAILSLSTDSLFFTAVSGGFNPPEQTFSIGNIGAGFINYSITENVDWLSVSPMSGGPLPPSAFETVTINISGLSVGSYEGEIIVLAPPALGSPDTVHVSLVLNPPELSVEPDSLVFYTLFGANPPDQTLQISSVGGAPFEYTIIDSIQWLTLFPMTGMVPPTDTVIVSVDTSGIPYGTYQDEIVIQSPGVVGSPKNIPITLYYYYFLVGPLSGILPPDTYKVDGNISVLYGDSLLIEAGTVLLFQGPYSFDIQGYLHVAGTESDTIKFMRDPLIPSWLGISFQEGASDSCLLEYCLATGSSQGGIECSHSSPIIRNCVINQNLCGGICCTYSNPNIYDCIISENVGGLCGGGIECSNSDAVISRCRISDNTSYWYGGGIRCINSDLHITECDIDGNISARSGGGIYCSDSNPLIYNCSVYGNTASYDGGGLYFEGSEPTIIECNIHENTTNYSGGGIYIDDSTPNINACDIYQNTSNAGGGIYANFSNLSLCDIEIIENTASVSGGGIYCNSCTTTVITCHINENDGGSSGGALYSVGDSLFLDHCVISNNDAILGGGLDLHDSKLHISNCTITSNSSNNYGSGMRCLQSDIELTNCIVEGNLESGIFFSGIGLIISVFYCDFANHPDGHFSGSVPPNLGIITTTNANGDSCDIFYNIFLDPLFYATTGDSAFYLTENSPCIDAGDPDNPLDPDSTIADMGAFYYHHLIPAVGDERNRIIPREFCLLPNYPNPFNPQTTLRFGLPRASMVSLKIYDICGRLIATLADRWYPAGYHQATFDASDLASGIYLARIQAGDFSGIRKLILIK